MIRCLLLAMAMSLGCGTTTSSIECGNGEREGAEECDEGDANGGASCCSTTCTLLAPAALCREAVGPCDLDETCDGTNGACPPDETATDGAPCEGNGESACSAADTCMAGVCEDNNMPANTSCSQDLTCNPDVCDGAGVCTDVTALADNTSCSDNGGSLCCAGVCSVASAACDACAARDPGSLVIAIIESQSISTAQNMDDRWKAIADGEGHVATIHPQTFLDDANNLANVDILIVASHEIAVPQNRRDTISAFVTVGKGAYIQGEFDPASFEGNKVWESVVDALGAGFTWGAQVQNSFPVNAAGCMAATPNAVPQGTVNFGATGSAQVGNRFAGILIAQPTGANPAPIGFRFSRNGGGLVMTTTDKDNIRAQSAGVPEFMKNVLFRLAHPDKCAP